MNFIFKPFHSCRRVIVNREMFRQSSGAISISIATLILQSTNDMDSKFAIAFEWLDIILVTAIRRCVYSVIKTAQQITSLIAA